MRSFSRALLAFAALVLAACGAGGGAPAATASPAVSAPSSPSAAPSTGGTVTGEDLEGRTFIVTEADGYTIVGGSEISLTFRGGQVGIRAGCNQMSGAFDIQDGRLVVGGIGGTEMACDAPLMTQDSWVSAFLPDTAITLDGDTLTLAKDGVTLTATDEEVANPDRPIEGTTWIVDGLVADQAVSSLPVGVTASLTFADGKVEVQAGCNSGSGAAAIDEDLVTFGPIATTRMACEEPAMQVERHVLGVLSGDVAAQVDADTLQLSGAGGGLVLKAQG